MVARRRAWSPPVESRRSRSAAFPVNSLFLLVSFPVLPKKIPVNFVGNFTKRRCSTAVSCLGAGSRGPEIVEFPVKFPVSREFQWRPARSALRRQPASSDVPATRAKPVQAARHAIYAQCAWRYEARACLVLCASCNNLKPEGEAVGVAAARDSSRRKVK